MAKTNYHLFPFNCDNSVEINGILIMLMYVKRHDCLRLVVSNQRKSEMDRSQQKPVVSQDYDHHKPEQIVEAYKAFSDYVEAAHLSDSTEQAPAQTG